MGIRRIYRYCVLSLTSLACAGVALAQERWQVDAIRIVGNKVTKPEVIERELAVAVGDTLTPELLVDSRQSVQNLGLFRDVRIELEPTDAGPGNTVTMVVHVREKRYFLPIPRIDTSSDLDYTYGAQLLWSNVWGLNHRFSAYFEQTEYKDDRNRDSSTSARITYSAPHLAGSDYGSRLLIDQTEQVTIDRRDPNQDDPRTFDETFHRVELLGTRDLRRNRPRQGWTLGTGLYWQNQSTKGPQAPPSDGSATALVGIASYDDMAFNYYSSTGRRFDARMEVAFDGIASRYGYERLQFDYRDYRQLGQTPHQTVHLIVGGGSVTGGPRSRNNFSLGGSSRLRGYDSDAIEGDTYWHVAGEYLRPIRWDWLRLLAVAEIGSARRNVFGEHNKELYASVGLGVRARISWFVDIDIELGIAMPLIDGDGPRFFGRSL